MNEVNLFGPIGAPEGVTAQALLAEVAAIDAPRIKLSINSPGGSVAEAIAIVNGLRATGKAIDVHILGIAASAASYIAMVGAAITMPSNTMMFLHDPIVGAQGNAKDLRESADTLDKFGEVLVAAYSKRFKGSPAKLRALLAAETWLTAAECLELGLCDVVTDAATVTAAFDVSHLPAAVQALFEAAPMPRTPLAEHVTALADAHGLAACIPAFLSDPAVNSIATAEAVIGRAAEIQVLARIADLPHLTEGFIRERKTLPQVRAALNAAQVEQDLATRIDTARRSDTLAEAAEWSPTSLWAEIRAMKAGSKK